MNELLRVVRKGRLAFDSPLCASSGGGCSSSKAPSRPANGVKRGFRRSEECVVFETLPFLLPGDIPPTLLKSEVTRSLWPQLANRPHLDVCGVKSLDLMWSHVRNIPL